MDIPLTCKNLSHSKIITDTDGDRSTHFQSGTLINTVSNGSVLYDKTNSEFALQSSRMNSPSVREDISGYKYFRKNNPKKKKYRKMSPEELNKLFNPEMDRQNLKYQEMEFDDDQKVSLLREISAQYEVDKDRELKIKRGIVADLSAQPVPRVPKILQNFCKRYIKQENK